jgi:endonuclease G
MALLAGSTSLGPTLPGPSRAHVPQSPTNLELSEGVGADLPDASGRPSVSGAHRRPETDGALQLALDAAARWRSREPERARQVTALESRRYVTADTPEHLAQWITRRRLWSAALAGRGTSDVATAAAPEPVNAEDITDQLVERVIDETNDLLSIEFFEMGLLAARCVGRVVTRGTSGTRFGTGFLVAPGLMLTNQHVLRTAEDARASVLELDYEDNRIGEAKPVHTFSLLPDRFFLGDEHLDFAIVAVDLSCVDGDAQLDSFKVLPLIDAQGKTRVGDPVNIVQHPGGRPKQVVVRNNEILDLPESRDVDDFVHYKADTEQGSSGSPVFNDLWEVVCLHHSGVPKTNDRGEMVDRDGNVLVHPRREDVVWVGNEGIRISRIVQAISEAPLPPDMALLRDQAVATWQLRGRPSVAESVAHHPHVVTDDAPTVPGTRVAPNSAPATTTTIVHAAPGPAASTARGVLIDLTVPIRLTVSLG